MYVCVWDEEWEARTASPQGMRARQARRCSAVDSRSTREREGKEREGKEREGKEREGKERVRGGAARLGWATRRLSQTGGVRRGGDARRARAYLVDGFRLSLGHEAAEDAVREGDKAPRDDESRRPYVPVAEDPPMAVLALVGHPALVEADEADSDDAADNADGREGKELTDTDL